MQKNKSLQPTFWVSNVSNRNVSLGDLNLTIKAFSSVNLLDSRHYHYTFEQLSNSVKSGSIFAKRDKIFVRKNSPQEIKNTKLIDLVAPIPSVGRSTFQIKEDKSDELLTSDDEFAEENAEFADMDQQKQYFTKE